MVWNGEVERKDLQGGCKCCCQCRGVISSHGYWTEYTMRSSPYDPANPAVRTWSGWFSLTRVPEIVGGSKLCQPCVWISADKKFAVGDVDGLGSGVWGINTLIQDGFWTFAPTPQNTNYSDGSGNTGPSVRCNYSAVYDNGVGKSVGISGISTVGGRRELFPFGQGIGTLPATGEIITGANGFVFEYQAAGRFICCSRCCATAPSGDLEMTVVGCGGSPSPIVITLPRTAANTYTTGGFQFLREALHWEAADRSYTFGCDDHFSTIPNTKGYVLHGSSIVGGLKINSWLQCDIGSDFIASFANVEYICPDSVHRYVNIEVRQSGGGGLPGYGAYGYGYGDCFPYGNSPPTTPPPPPPPPGTIKGLVTDGSHPAGVGGVTVTCSDGQSLTTVAGMQYSFTVAAGTWGVFVSGASPAGYTVTVPPSATGVDFAV